MNNFLKKFLVVVLGIVFTFVVLEVGLRVSGVLMRKRYLKKVEERGESADYTILCVGNCYTAGVGAPAGRSYPEFLQTILSEKYPEKMITVVNRGLPGRNSHQILVALNLDIEETDPDLVIVRAGSANFFNHIGFGEYMKEQGGKNKLQIAFQQSGELLYSLKTVQLMRHLAQNLRDKHQGTVTDGMEGHTHDRIDGGDPERFRTLMAEGREHQGLGDMAGAIKKYTVALKAAPDSIARNSAYFAMIDISNALGEEDVERIIKDAGGDESWAGRGKTQNDLLNDWARSDLESMVLDVRDRGIPLIIQNYPILFNVDTGIAPPGAGSGIFSDPPQRQFMLRVNRTMKEYAQKQDIPFIDNESYYRDELSRGNKSFIQVTRYPNALGYRLMAENVAERIEEEGYL